ncbi:MAG: carboxylesterase/lipase family protein [Candidatus Hodarchaeota archaeon]
MVKIDPVVETKLGKIKGIQKQSHQEYLGIRYAKPPIKELRFQVPHPVAPWEEIYEATKYGPIAPQAWDDNPPISMKESEDCLFLNIYTPNADGKKRPVMVYIHGGGFSIGTGSRGRLYGGNLAKHGEMVVVTIQYRLGVLGFLYIDNISPNLGLQDQLCALRWIKNNISVFGGDPDNITIFGQSAGGASVSYLLIMPQAKGLFHKAIAQSGAISLKTLQMGNSYNNSRELLKRVNISPGNLDALQKISLNKLLSVHKKMTGGSILSEKLFFPVLDGTVIPENVYEAMRTGFAKDIPFLLGFNEDEFPIFASYLKSKKIQQFFVKSFINRILQKFGLSKSLIKNLLSDYRKELKKKDYISNQEYDQVISDVVFRIPITKQAEAHSESNANTYFYIFTYKAPNLNAAVHVLELFFVFGTIETSDVSKEMKLINSLEERKLSKLMMDTWIQFARYGNPNQPNLPEWPVYNLSERATMVLNTSPKVVNGSMKVEREIWEKNGLF